MRAMSLLPEVPPTRLLTQDTVRDTVDGDTVDPNPNHINQIPLLHFNPPHPLMEMKM